MLEARNISYEIQGDEDAVFLLNKVNFCIPKGHFTAIVGPSGCGKTTLLKTIAGIIEETEGSFIWENRNLAEDGDFEPGEIGYVPQFSIAYDELTVEESVEYAARLRVKTDSEDEINDIIDRVLEETGLSDIADRRVKILSGGQKRRLALAMELVSSPKLLLCDEVTSGLDPRSEREIVELLYNLSQKEGRIVISVTHSLAMMELYDSVLVMNKGCVAFHGSPGTMCHYFGVSDLEEVYPRLACRNSEEWRESWSKHRGSYYERLERNHIEKFTLLGQRPPDDTPSNVREDEEEMPTPGFWTQFSVLLNRRFKVMSRDRGQLLLQVAMILIFPMIVALFADKGNEQLQQLTQSRSADLTEEIQQQQDVASARAKVGSAVSGLIMFEVILLGLMGSNNSAREIAGERHIVEKERFAGVSSGAYLASKGVYLAILLLVQSVWMYLFVQQFWHFRGDSLVHLQFLIGANAAMTAVCLGISANARTADQASLLSIYLVGFQLPLSGAILALPQAMESIIQPFISAYWAWSGSIMGGLEPEVLKAVNSIAATTFKAPTLCSVVLTAHVVVGILLAWIGLKRSQAQ